MIDKEATIKEFGYNPDNLKPKSHKKVYAICENCGKIRCVRKVDYGDLCRFCAGKKLGLNNKGRIPSEETKEKLSIAGKGRICSEETKKKISESNKNKKLSKETKRKIGLAGKGRVCLEKTKKKISKSMKGKNAGKNNPMYGKTGNKNPMWKNGKSFEPYCLQFNNNIKEKIREQYNRTCILCRKTEEKNGRKLCVHHIDYNKNQGCESITWKLVPLCAQCHGKTNNNREVWKNYFEEGLS